MHSLLRSREEDTDDSLTCLLKTCQTDETGISYLERKRILLVVGQCCIELPFLLTSFFNSLKCVEFCSDYLNCFKAILLPQ